MPLLELALLSSVAVFVHVSALALFAAVAGVPVREIRYGVGPVLVRFGRYRVSLLPLGGSVRMKDSRSEATTGEAIRDAYDHQPRWKQAVIPLCGALTLLALSLALLGSEAVEAFKRAFGQVFVGVLSPLSEAQALLAGFFSYLNERSVLDSLGLFFAKMAALNLLPVPMLNGGDALLALLGMNSASERANAILRQIAIWPMLLVWCSWLVAGAVYAFS